jgi:asparagine synthase (glutamine-hydrolysing)
MTDALVHRGPDSEGQWVDEALGVALGHRSLEVIEMYVT